MSCKEKGLKSSLAVCPLNNLQSLTSYLRLNLAFCQIAHYGESSLSVLQGFLLVSTKFLFWQEDWTLGYYSMKFILLYFPDIS